MVCIPQDMVIIFDYNAYGTQEIRINLFSFSWKMRAVKPYR